MGREGGASSSGRDCGAAPAECGARCRLAAAHAGVNNNLLAPGELVDEISGNQVVNGIPVEIAPL